MIGAAIGTLVTYLVGDAIARLKSSTEALVLVLLVLGGSAIASAVLEATDVIDPPIALGPGLVIALGMATALARPPSWREPVELGRLAETTLLLAQVFAYRDLATVALLWMLSTLPGLRIREKVGVSRRPLFFSASIGVVLVGGAMLAWMARVPASAAAVAVALAVGGAVRMGVPPFSPLTMTTYERLPLGRTALVAAARPSVALLLATRDALPQTVEVLAPFLQPWAAIAALVASLQGLAARTPRRRIGAMAATQSCIILYGLSAPGEVGRLGAIVQWAGLGISLLGLGLVVEAIESRVGQRRAPRVRGLSGPAPGMALFFLLFAMTMSGFPGTSGFVGEDLIMQAPGSHVLLFRCLLLAATTLNGITMLRMFARTFLGPLVPAEARAFPSFTPRERWVLGGMAMALAVLTAYPNVVR